MAKDLLDTDEGRAWLISEATLKASREWGARVSQARENLFARCRASIDPGVRDAYAKLEVLEQITKYLTGVK